MAYEKPRRESTDTRRIVRRSHAPLPGPRTLPFLITNPRTNIYTCECDAGSNLNGSCAEPSNGRVRYNIQIQTEGVHRQGGWVPISQYLTLSVRVRMWRTRGIRGCIRHLTDVATKESDVPMQNTKNGHACNAPRPKHGMRVPPEKYTAQYSTAF